MAGSKILVVGSVAYDNVVSPEGRREEQLGGTAVYFSVSASYFASPGVVGVVGNDFNKKDVEMLQAKGIDTSGLAFAEGETFRWSGSYEEDLNTAVTLDTRLNVFETFSPELTDDHKSTPYLFLGNIDPELQNLVLDQMSPRPGIVACDTMNLWIDIKRESLSRLVDSVDVLLINEAEAGQFTGETSLVSAAQSLMNRGLKTLVIKRGEYGAVIFHPSFTFAVPAYPMATVKDPTGAGDTFAGGFMGYLAAVGARLGEDDADAIRRAGVVGSVMASFTVEDFGLDRLQNLSHDEINDRFNAFSDLTRFQSLDGEGLPTP